MRNVYTMKKSNIYVLVGVLICFLFLLVVCCFYSFIKEKGKKGLYINSESIAIKEDTLYYSEPLSISCDSCFLNGKEIAHTTIKDAGDYEITYNHVVIKVNLDYDRGFTISDYYGKEIHNYDSNIFPFEIETSSEIFVNGEDYDHQRIYEYGTYVLKNGDKEVKIQIREVESSHDYDLYLTAGTLSSLYASLLMAKEENYNHTFVWCGRDTFDEDYLKKQGVTISSYSEDATHYEDMLKEVKNYIYEIMKQDEQAHFRMYMNEVDYSFVLSTFYELGLQKDRFDVNIITDGTISYSMDYSYFHKDTYTYYKEFYMLLEEGVKKIYQGDTVGSAYSNKEYIIPYLVQSGATYYLQYPTYFSSLDKKVNQELSKIRYNDVSLRSLYTELNSTQKEKFFSIISFDKDVMDEEYFGDAAKPYLIITGNTPMDYGFGTTKFKDTIAYVVREYGDSYHILFKPHPRAIPDDDYMAFFEELSIKVLPGQMPMEAISFVYDVKLGGFPSSLYMSSDAANVLFFFAKDKNDMFEPLPRMIDDTFKNVEIINPRKVV